MQKLSLFFKLKLFFPKSQMTEGFSIIILYIQFMESFGYKTSKARLKAAPPQGTYRRLDHITWGPLKISPKKPELKVCHRYCLSVLICYVWLAIKSGIHIVTLYVLSKCRSFEQRAHNKSFCLDFTVFLLKKTSPCHIWTWARKGSIITKSLLT